VEKLVSTRWSAYLHHSACCNRKPLL